MTSDHESKLLSPKEKAFVDRLATHYAPTPTTPAQRITFARALEERIARRARVSFLRPVAVVATACAALLMWLAAPYQGTHLPNEVEHHGAIVVERESTVHREGEENLLTYAYYGPEFYEDEDEGEEVSFLPDEYETLVSALALSDDA